MRQIHGKTALVTGAASGIGRAIALRLADEGARLYLLDIDAVGMAKVVAEVRNRGVDALAHQCDLAVPRDVTAAVHHLLDRFGGVDILVNNAGITYYGKTLDMTADHWRRLLAVNLLAPIQLTSELLPTLLSRSEAHVLNVASVCGLVGLARVTAYTTSKFGLVGFSESLRAEYLRKGLGVTALCPGLVDTNLFAAAPRGRDRDQNKLPPRWLLASPETVARRAIRAIYRNQAVVVVQPAARLLHLAKRLTPWLLDFANGISRRPHRTPPADAKPVDDSTRRVA
jgi:NAD(P)-dependent dehydrogenase (short-subunit alcohol dehydrogenase family)